MDLQAISNNPIYDLKTSYIQLAFGWDETSGYLAPKHSSQIQSIACHLQAHEERKALGSFVFPGLSGSFRVFPGLSGSFRAVLTHTRELHTISAKKIAPYAYVEAT